MITMLTSNTTPQTIALHRTRRCTLLLLGALIGSFVFSSTISANAQSPSLFIVPQHPRENDLVRILVVSEHPLKNPTLELINSSAPAKNLTQPPSLEGGGPPYFILFAFPQLRVGRYQVTLSQNPEESKGLAEKTPGPLRRVMTVTRIAGSRQPQNDQAPEFWPITRTWNRESENLFSAWIEILFSAPIGERPSWRPLDEVWRDPARNILYNYLGQNEDGPNTENAIASQPDCADLPYHLRAYFAWKLQLPFAFRPCSRGSSTTPPRCTADLLQPPAIVPPFDQPLAKFFSQYLRKDVGRVHSAAGRTAAADNNTDFYPLRLTRDALRPGSVYVDPYGHLLVIAKWVEQPAAGSGLLYAVDGHPDLSVGRKRFWRGAFMFLQDPSGGSVGFKAFRPLRKDADGLRSLSNDEIARDSEYGSFSAEQSTFTAEQFYERMETLINPRPLSPIAAYEEQLTALYESLQERVDSVQAGDDYLRQTKFQIVPMPDGPKIFETIGAWEDYSTPARDFRLQLAIHDVLSFSQRVAAHPERFARAANETDATVNAAMNALFEKFTRQHTIQYRRSDGKDVTLTMSEVIKRRAALEMAYNPNDCNEVRWGASGDELATCQRRAPAEQQQRMAEYRTWFATRTRPAIR